MPNFGVNPNFLPPTRQFLQHLNDWFYRELSAQAHLSFHGMMILGAGILHNTVDKETREQMGEGSPGRRIVCAFQPHTHDRTLKLWKEFSVSFRGASLVIIPNIYDARAESDSGKADVSSFVKAVSEGSEVTCINGKSIPDALDFLKKELKHGDVLVVMGAGNITNLAGDYLKSN